MFNRIPKCWLAICIVIFGLLVISACSEPNNQSGYIADRKTESSASNNDIILAEYIIVLEENVSIADAIDNFHIYEAQVIRDLKRGRYLIGLKIDPGIERLKKEVEGSDRIKYIQPNFTYTIQ